MFRLLTCGCGLEIGKLTQILGHNGEAHSFRPQMSWPNLSTIHISGCVDAARIAENTSAWPFLPSGNASFDVRLTIRCKRRGRRPLRSNHPCLWFLQSWPLGLSRSRGTGCIQQDQLLSMLAMWFHQRKVSLDVLTEKPDSPPLIDNYCAHVVEARCDGTVQCSKNKGHSSFLPQAFVEEDAVIWFG